MDVMEAIRTRRSIRRYKPDPVDEETLKTVLEAARLAPSWGNKQCWRFIVVRDNNVKAELADSLVQVEIGGALADNPVRFRFHLRGGSLYSFWVSPDKAGASHGYVGAGGPGLTGPTDTVGRGAAQASS